MVCWLPATVWKRSLSSRACFGLHKQKWLRTPRSSLGGTMLCYLQHLSCSDLAGTPLLVIFHPGVLKTDSSVSCARAGKPTGRLLTAQGGQTCKQTWSCFIEQPANEFSSRDMLRIWLYNALRCCPNAQLLLCGQT